MSKQIFYKASITVEAVLLLPILLFVIFTFMYTGLYFYDQVCIDTQIRTAIMKQEQKICHTIDEDTGMILYDEVSVKGLENLRHNYREEEIQIASQLKEIGKTMFQGKVRNQIIKIENDKIEINVVSELLFLTKALGNYLPKSNRSNNHYVKMAVHNPQEFVRVYTALEEVAQQTGQGSKIKSVLKNLLKFM